LERHGVKQLMSLTQDSVGEQTKGIRPQKNFSPNTLQDKKTFTRGHMDHFYYKMIKNMPDCNPYPQNNCLVTIVT